MQRETSAVGHPQVMEADFDFAQGREIRIQRAESTLAFGERFDLRDFADDLGTNGYDNVIERIDRLHDTRVDRLSYLLHPDFFIQGNLQRGAFRYGQSNRLRGGGLGELTWFGCRFARGTWSELRDGNFLSFNLRSDRAGAGPKSEEHT